MSGKEYPLALELLAIGRVFFFQTGYASVFPPALVPHRQRRVTADSDSIRPFVFNPELGRGVTEMLHRVIACCGRRDWEHAEEWCCAASQVKTLGAMYRGSINIALATATVEYYSAVVFVGKRDWLAAYKLLEGCAEQLAFTAPDRAAAVSLTLAKMHRFQREPANALWSLQKCEGLLQDMESPALGVLIPLVAVEYDQISVNYKI